MILTCPSCGTRYRAEPVNFKPPGRNVRCAKCSHVWFQAAPEPEIPAASAVTPEQPAAKASDLAELRAIVPEPNERIEMHDVRDRLRSRAAAGGRTLQVLGFAVLMILLAATGWAAVHYRQTVVRLWPASARLYAAARLPVNLTGIAITNIDLRQELQDGMPILSVTGDVVNVSNRDQPIPKLRVVLLDDSKRELYRWTFDPGIPSLKPGSRRVFDTKLPSPPPDARSATVTVASEDGG